MIQNGMQGAFVESAARSRPLLAGANRREDANTAEQQFAAAKYVTSRAVDDEDALELLQMLGLVDPPWEWVGATHPRRRVERQ